MACVMKRSKCLMDTEALINKWHGIDRLGYAITYYVGREGATKAGLSLTPQQLWWQHTAGAAQALGLAGVVGNLQPGCEADFVIINPQATPLLARKTAHANTLDELLFALIALGDDRLIEKTVISQAVDV